MSVDLTEPRPALSAEVMRVFSSRFEVHPVVPPRDLGGWFSLNVLMETQAGRYVVRVHGTQTQPARLRAIQRARRHLAAGGVPAPQQVLTADGAPFVSVAGHLLEVELYVEHDAGMSTWHRLELGLPYLGRTHTLFQSLHIGAAGRRAPLANHIELDRALAGTLRGVERIRSWNPTADELVTATSFEELAHLVHETEHASVDDLPRQLVHGDFWGNNVLFRGDAVVLVTDLDFMAERLRIDDLALTMFFANSTIGGDRLSGERIDQMRTLVDAYDSGLSDHLSAAERRALPAAIARQTLWSIGWWVPALPEDRARKQVAWRAVDAEWTLGLMRNLREWQQAFTEG
jgi:Ser/Thr protein kinase RdoA (MazF antagonist)